MTSSVSRFELVRFRDLCWRFQPEQNPARSLSWPNERSFPRAQEPGSLFSQKGGLEIGKKGFGSSYIVHTFEMIIANDKVRLLKALLFNDNEW